MTQHNQDDQWDDCPAGEVADLVNRLHARRRREHLRQVSVGVACLGIVLIAGVYAIPHFLQVEPHFGGIVCSDVKSMADDYIAGRLDEHTTAQIDAHLKWCEPCRQLIDRIRDQRSANLQSDSSTQAPVEQRDRAPVFITSLAR